MSGLAIAILAAGRARRFGGGKLDAELAGKPLGRWALDAARGVEHAQLAVVAADPAPLFARAAGCELLSNRRADQGLGTSVAVAARWAAESGSDALLILLADMPLVSLTTLDKLSEFAGTPAAVAYPGGRPGVPACFPAVLFPALERLTGDAGAAQVLHSLPEVRIVETPERELCDVDRPQDLADIARQLASR